MAIALRYAARSDIGLGRYRNNQDSAYAGPHLLVVADGMGGHAGGDVASSIAVGELSTLDGESHGPEAMRHLERSIARARDLIARRVGEDPELAGMGTTVTALLRSGRKLVLAHIGDSRAYLLHEGRLTRVTKDHTFVQSLIDEGRITEDEAERHPQRSVIMRVLGDVDAGSDVDTSVREASVGDRWLLCSDGLSGVVSDETLEETLRDVTDPAECAEQLVSLALRAGGPDNITCIVADVVEVTTTPDSTPQVVGAAAAARARDSLAADTPAARAAALVADDEQDHPDDEDDGPSRWRAVRRLVAVAVVVALLVGGGWAAYAWSQQQYYVGTVGASDDARVAIYRGLTQDVGPLRLSGVYEEQDLPLDALPAVWRQRVESGITAESLDDARRIVRDLLRRSELCEPEPAAAAPTPTATPSPSPSPTAGATPTPSPTSALTAVPSPSPTETLPEGCEEAG
ncbi:MAG: PP2C family protein-serine/threonine phosphatase [Actinomycetes bacterium]